MSRLGQETDLGHVTEVLLECERVGMRNPATVISEDWFISYVAVCWLRSNFSKVFPTNGYLELQVIIASCFISGFLLAN